MYATTIACSTALASIIILIFLIRNNLNGLLKDQSTQPLNLAPYSLSRTLLFYWTIIIVFSICFIGIMDDKLATIDSGVLILLGIAAGTATVGKIIDTNQSQNPALTTVIQNFPSQGFLTDILSDSNGISTSRFQSVVFNLIFGCVFIGFAVSKHVLYDFSSTTLTLLGISSGAYALMKIPENK